MSLSESMSPADFAAMSNNGMDGSWWLIILFLFIFSGWNGNNNSGANDNYVLASDFATLQRQIDASADRLSQQSVQIANGICDGFYAQNTTLLNGFAGVNSAISTNGYETRDAIQAAQISGMQSANTIQNSISSGFCQTNYNAQANARDIIDAQNNNTQAILAAIQQNKVDAMQDKIAELQTQNQALNLAASQAAQNAYLVQTLKPAPVPSFPASSLYGYYGTCSCGN